LSFAPLRWLGLISYGLYLWHWPVFVWLDPVRTGLDGWALTGLRVGVTLAVSIVSYVLVEQPIRGGAWRGWRIRLVTPAAAIVTIALVLIATSGTVAEPTVASSTSSSRHLVPAALPPSSPGARRALIVGDSVAVFLAPALEQVQPSAGMTTFTAAIPGCEVARADRHRAPSGMNGLAGDPITDPATCSHWPTRWRDLLAELHPDAAILIVGFPAVQDLEVNGAWHEPCSKWWNQYYRSEAVDALRILGSSGTHVWVTTAAPPAAFYFPKSLITQTGCLNRALIDAASLTRSSILDVAAYVCPKGRCQESIDGQLLRPDGFHYSGPGGLVVARWLLGQVTQPPTIPSSIPPRSATASP
jgi:hypothetical protein